MNLECTKMAEPTCGTWLRYNVKLLLVLVGKANLPNTASPWNTQVEFLPAETRDETGAKGRETARLITPRGFTEGMLQAKWKG